MVISQRDDVCAFFALLLDASTLHAQQDLLSALQMAQRSAMKIRAVQENFASEATGTVLDGDLIVTNYHVVRGAARIEATLEGSSFHLEPLVLKPEWDLALLRIQSPPQVRPYQAMPLEAGRVAPGSDVYAIGFPLGLGYSVNKGVVSGYRVLSDLPPAYKGLQDLESSSVWVQTDCPINPGNSGGPLISSSGSIIGINTWGSRVDNDVYFAIDVSFVQKLLQLPRSADQQQSERPQLLRIGSEQSYLRLSGPNPQSPGVLQLSVPPDYSVELDGIILGHVPVDASRIFIEGVSLRHPHIVALRRPEFATKFAMLEVPETGVLVHD